MLASPAIHPFPARMAPELVAQALADLRAGARVLDPMMGSGSFPLAAGRAGHFALGIDTDPLAVLISRTGRCLWDTDAVVGAGDAVVRQAERVSSEWIHPDPESDRFIDYWFDAQAKQRLGRLAMAISDLPPAVQDPLWVAFSRLIVTKDSGASKARDVSHSRPHRVRDFASFDPIERFTKALHTVLGRALTYGAARHGGHVEILRADARALPLQDASVDMIMTSPPYLTAIDYLRGHRLSLVWMGFLVAELRQLRSSNIGAERRGRDLTRREEVLETYEHAGFSSRCSGILANYVGDLNSVLSEAARVLQPRGVAIFVVADATVEGRPVNIAQLVEVLAERNNIRTVQKDIRDLPSDRRYLPPPDKASKNTLTRRMRTETVLRLQRDV